MARGAIRCTGCSTPLTFHCPPTNSVCTWLACLNASCNVRYLDTNRGTIQHTDGRVETWAEQPTTSQPPTIDINDETDGRPATPDP